MSKIANLRTHCRFGLVDGSWVWPNQIPKECNFHMKDLDNIIGSDFMFLGKGNRACHSPALDLNFPKIEHDELLTPYHNFAFLDSLSDMYVHFGAR